VNFEPTTVGLGAVIAILSGVAVVIVRFFVDRPRNKVLREDVEDLKLSRDDARKELGLVSADAKADREHFETEITKTKAEALAAKELATSRARVDELFAWMKDLVAKGQPRQEQLMEEIASLGRNLMDAVATGHALRGETLNLIQKHELEAIARHEALMRLAKAQTDLLGRIASAFDVKMNGPDSR
jgi:hypothetical protein